MSLSECLFCKMVAGDIAITKIYEDDVILAFLDINPVSDGHTLVIPKQHFEKVHECPPELLAQVAARLGKIAQAVISAMTSQGYNILCNNGSAAGQVISHVHFHIIPRNNGDEVFNRWPAYNYEQGRIEEIKALISKKL